MIAFTWTWGDFIAPAAAAVQRQHHAGRRRHDHLRHREPGLPSTTSAAGAVMYVVPILLIFLIAQRGFVAGMSTSGLK